MSKITLKGIKIAKFASQETYCYQATLFFNGKKCASVSNDGHGGCDNQYVTNKKVWDEMLAYIETLPEVESRALGDRNYKYKPSVETICGDLVSQFIARGDLRAMLKNRVVLVENGECRTTKIERDKASLENMIELVKQWHPNATILNTLDLDAAFNLYMECA